MKRRPARPAEIINGEDIANTSYAVNNIYLNGLRIAASLPNGECQYYLTDQVDSVSLVTDDKSEIVTRTEYLPFGETWFQEGDTKNRPKFNSQELDPETGFYFFNARYQDPEICRFVTADSVVPYEDNTQSWNRYSYCRNNPIIYKDPTGHEEKTTSDHVLGFFSGAAKAYASDLASSVELMSGLPGLVKQNYDTVKAFAKVAKDVSSHPNGLKGYVKDKANEIVQSAKSDPGSFAGSAAVRVAETFVGGRGAVKGTGKATESLTSDAAKASQGTVRYPGVDEWKDSVLKKGRYVYGGTPGQSEFYTTETALKNSGGDAAKLFQSLQVAPDKKLGYRNEMTKYRVREDVGVATSKATANPQHGQGGAYQYFIPNYEDVLTPVKKTPLK